MCDEIINALIELDKNHDSRSIDPYSVIPKPEQRASVNPPVVKRCGGSFCLSCGTSTLKPCKQTTDYMASLYH
jgi:hypothetical protein